jgi:glutathione S-transferase
MHSSFFALRTWCGMNVGVRVQLREWPPALSADVRRLEELWHEGFAGFGGPFLAGPQFTIVDAFFCPVAFRAQTYGIALAPEAQAYVQRLLDLPAMRAWQAAALAEPWRDEPHEIEMREYGEVTGDLRVPMGSSA